MGMRYNSLLLRYEGTLPNGTLVTVDGTLFKDELERIVARTATPANMVLHELLKPELWHPSNFATGLVNHHTIDEQNV